MNRADGYTTDVDFPAFFYKELQPVWLACVAHLQGFAAPDVAGHFRYCELGCGAGINLLVAAACHPQARFIGVDINARQLKTARAAAQAAGLTNVDFVHSDFAQFAGSAALPGTEVGTKARTEARTVANLETGPFDFMVSHGVWSWISPRHQASLLACVGAGLAPGGLFCLHYMCHPGSTDLQNIQHLLNSFAPQVPGSSARQVEMGLKLLHQLANRGAFVDRPDIRRHLDRLQARHPDDLAHEFLTDHWQPGHSVAVHREVGELGLSLLGSADVFNNLDVSLSIPGNMQEVIRLTASPPLAESLKDFARNSHQRMDLFQRDARPLGEVGHLSVVGATSFQGLPGAPVQGPFRFATPIGPIEGPETLCATVMQRLAAGPASFTELAALPALSGRTDLLLQTMQLLLMQGWAHPVNPAQVDRPNPADPAGGEGRARKLDRWLAGNGLALRTLASCGTAVRTGD